MKIVLKEKIYIFEKIIRWKCFFEHLVLITGIKKCTQKCKSQL